MGFTLSPLRYPGGKTRLTSYIRSILEYNNLIGRAYIEIFAGGAGIAWALLFDGSVSSVYLNDLDPAVYSFWYCVCEKTEEICRRIRNTRINLNVWKKYKRILNEPSDYSILDLGFAALFLNRTNRSGVLRGGIIGGKNQDGKWKMGCRFDKKVLIKRINQIAFYRNNIHLFHMEARNFIKYKLPEIPKHSLVYLDPPYLNRGDSLYLNLYNKKDHHELALDIQNRISQPWIVSYDNSPDIRKFYPGVNRLKYSLTYFAATRYSGSELLFFSPNLRIPQKTVKVSSGYTEDKY